VRERPDRDDPMNELLKVELPARLEPGSPACLDAETLAAWVDGTLSDRELAQVEAHVADCARCQAIAAGVADMASDVTGDRAAGPAGAKHPAAGAGWPLRWLAPIAAAAAVALIWIALPDRSSDPTGAATAVARLEQTDELAAEPAAASPTASQEVLESPAAPAESPNSDASSDSAAPIGQMARAEVAVREAPTEASPIPAAPPAPAAARPAGTETAAGVASGSEERTAVAERGDVQAAAGRLPSPAEQEAVDARFANQGLAGRGGGGRGVAYRPEDDRETNFIIVAKREEDRQEQAPLARSAVADSPDNGQSVMWRVQRGIVEHSVDSGGTWAQVTLPVSTRLNAGSAPSPDVCWLVGDGGVVLRTIDGTDFEQIGFPRSATLVSVEADDANRARVTTDTGTVFTTDDGGRTWEQD